MAKISIIIELGRRGFRRYLKAGSCTLPASIRLVILDQAVDQYLLFLVQNELVESEASALLNDDRYQHSPGQTDQHERDGKFESE